MAREPSLHDVFGIAEHVKEYSYVDRGGLDAQMRYALSTERHIAIHGASKQGKSWLRSRVLDEDSFVLVQCQTGSSLESIFTDALGALGIRAEIRRTNGNDFEGTIDFKGSGSIGVHLLGKIGIEAKSGAKRTRTKETESEPLGQTPANLWWVARTFLAAQKRLVIEDCHYLSDDCLRDLAFTLKAIGGYGLHVLIVGIWAQDHLMTYYNGDLIGRMEDVHLTWRDQDLDAVLRAGSAALNIGMSTSLRRLMITDAAGNVGLLQQLAEALCREEKVFSHEIEFRFLTPGPSLDRARASVAGGMEQRFHLFADNFEGAVRRACSVTCDPQLVLRTLMNCTDEQLLQGVEKDALVRAIRSNQVSISMTGLDEMMKSLADAQASMGIHPPVVAYNSHTQKLSVTDRSLLFYRRCCSPSWLKL